MQRSINHETYKAYAGFLRYLSADMVSRAKGGHLSMPLGFADVMSVLATRFLNYHSLDPKWFNRDRLILSAGHGSALLYAFYFLAGYEDCTLEDLKQFRKFGAKASSHPEYGKFAATETTTGLLGQGFATAVGMAIAQKKTESSLPICDYKIYVIVGDGCLMEGISYEAASLAGHLGLNNLIVLFDDNRVTADGSTNLAVSEDHIAKFKALGWEAEAIDGHDYSEIENALSNAQKTDKPYFIACRTIAGFGTKKNDHMGEVSEQELENFRKNMSDFDSLSEVAEISKYHLWKTEMSTISKKQSLREAVGDAAISEPMESVDSEPNPLAGDSFLNFNKSPLSTRKAAALCLEKLIKQNSERFIIGSADLGSSTCIKFPSVKEITKEDFSGNYLNYGVREHAMGAMMNGIALSGFTVISSTYLSFSDYMRPAIRMAAMQKLPVIYFFTHDSIMIGEDGPTHQPIEHIDSLKLIPNVNVTRPYDLAETEECLDLAINADRPTILILSRQEIGSQNLSLRGIEDDAATSGDSKEYKKTSPLGKDLSFCIFASGSDVAIAHEIANILSKKYQGKVISVPFWPNNIEFNINAKIKIAIEMGTGISWKKIVGEDGLIFNIEDFGIAGESLLVTKHFKFTSEQIAESINLKLISL
jgi:transketolase